MSTVPVIHAVAIFAVTRAHTTFEWLCDGHSELLVQQGVAKYLGPCDQACHRCPPAPSKYLRPDGSVDFVPTSPTSRMPLPGEVPPHDLIVWPESLRPKQKRTKATTREITT